MKNYLIKKTALILLLILSVPFSAMAMESENSIPKFAAGSPVVIKLDNYSDQSKVNLLKPNGLNVRLESSEIINGKLLIDSYHTSSIGSYVISLVENNKVIEKHNFTIIADVTDPNKSAIILETLNTNKSVVEGRVNMKDKFGNSVSGVQTKIFSSKTGDTVIIKNAYSDQNGVVNFSLNSYEKGISTLIAYDLTNDVKLSKTAQVYFENNSDIGGDVILKANAQVAGPLFGFEISELPETIKVNENITFTLKAVDEDGLTVQDYSGTVRFSAEGDNSSGANLPSNYKFLAEDLGEHQFGLGLSFSEEGTYKIIVSDLADKFKTGEKTVIVGVEDVSSQQTNQNSDVEVLLKTPSEGTYSQSVQNVTGNTSSNYGVEIFDNNVKIGSTKADLTGKFTFQTPVLTDGIHEIYANVIEPISGQVRGTSSKVNVTIDTSAPKIEGFILDPKKDIKAGDVVKIRIASEANLSQAVALFNFNIIQLSPSTDDVTFYEGEFSAPAEAGTYSIDINLVDELGNEFTYEKQAELVVGENGIAIVREPVTKENPDNQEEPVEVDNEGNIELTESPVESLVAYGADSKITLVWDIADNAPQISKFKIYYGNEINNLSQSVVTNSNTKTWYVPALTNGKEYFFTIVPLDNENKELASKSEIVSGIPFVLEVNNVLNNLPGAVQIPKPDGLKPAAFDGPLPGRTSETGPEIAALFVVAAIAGRKFCSKK